MVVVWAGRYKLKDGAVAVQVTVWTENYVKC